MTASRIASTRIWTGVLLSSGVGLVALSAVHSQMAASSRQGRLITSQSALESALASVDGPTTLRIAPGRYGDLAIGSKQTGDLTIESADPAHPATFSGIHMFGARGVTLHNLAIERGTADPASRYVMTVFKSQEIRIDGLRITAPGAASAWNQTYAVMLRDCRDLRLTGARITGTRYGIGFLNLRDVTLSGNEIWGLQTDGIRGGGVQGLTIRGNVLTRFTPQKGDHPDGIQLWSTNEKTSSANIVISDNLVARDSGAITQGIFVDDKRAQLPFQHLTVTGNLLVGTMYNGIAISSTTNATIRDNEVIAYPDQKSWIRLEHGKMVELSDNRAQMYILANNTEIHQSDNKTTRPTRDNIPRRIREWLDTKPELSKDPGPILRELSGQPAN